MKFVDTCEVTVKAGDGGNGSIAFRREKFIPHGGPSGGDGGRGGDIVFIADAGLSTLLDLTYQRKIEAESGENGSGSDCYGHGGDDFVVRVPVGTQVHDTATDEIIADFTEEGQRVVIAQGGRGGRGNIHFATPLDRAPRRAETGDPGELFELRLELKVMADVGLLGFPNVGKSTFIRAVSRAKPKVADYPFTTLVPHLGVVQSDDDSFVIADIPGLIPGASEGAGLGLQFLRHVQRTRALLHLVTMSFDDERDPVADYDAIMKELKKYDPALAKRPMVVALSKADVTEVKESYEDLKKRFAKKRVKLRLISSATQEGITEMLRELRELVRTSNLELPPEEPAEPVVVRAPKVPAKRKKPSEM